MITAVDTEKVVTFISKYDTGEPQTKWLLGVITAKERNYITEQTSRVLGFESNKNEKDKITTKTDLHLDQRLRLTLSFGLKGWEDFYDKDGATPIPFRTEAASFGSLRSRVVVAQDLLEKIHHSVIEELAEEIDKINTLQPAEIKN